MKNQLTEVTDGLWEAHHDVYMPLRVHFDSRMVVVRLEDQSLWLHSSVPLNDASIAMLRGMGEVSHIVAPNQFHHLYVPTTSKLFPTAQRWAAPGLADKRRDIDFSATLAEGESPWPNLEWLQIEGLPNLNEVVFFHRPSKTLICTDLLFNIYEVENFRTQMILRAAGAWQHPKQSRLLRFMTRDHAAAARSVRQLLKWPFERVVMGHGKILDGPEVKADLIQALVWMLTGAQLELTAS